MRALMPPERDRRSSFDIDGCARPRTSCLSVRNFLQRLGRRANLEQGPATMDLLARPDAETERTGILSGLKWQSLECVRVRALAWPTPSMLYHLQPHVRAVSVPLRRRNGKTSRFMPARSGPRALMVVLPTRLYDHFLGMAVAKGGADAVARVACWGLGSEVGDWSGPVWGRESTRAH